MNFLHSKARNCLESERVDKLTYIYINTRIFRWINNEGFGFDIYELTEEEEVEFEQELLQAEGMSDIDEFEENESWFMQMKGLNGNGLIIFCQAY